MQAQQARLLDTDTIPFTLSEHHNIIVEGILNGRDTVPLMFHTAANDVSITEEAAERLMSIKWRDSLSQVMAWGGNSTQRSSAANALTIGQQTWDNLVIWQSKLSGPGTDGKFGPHLFEGKYVTLNYDKELLIIHNGLPDDIDTYEHIPIVYENGHMFIELAFGIKDTTLTKHCMIHSGYAGTVLFDDEFATAADLANKITITHSQDLKDSLGNLITSKKGSVPQLSLGNVVINTIPVGFFDGNKGIQRISVVGSDVLRRFHIIFNPDRTMLYMKPNNMFSLPFQP